MKVLTSAFTLLSVVSVLGLSLGTNPVMAQDKATKAGKAVVATPATKDKAPAKPKAKVVKAKIGKKAAKKVVVRKHGAAKAVSAAPTAKTAPAKK